MIKKDKIRQLSRVKWISVLLVLLGQVVMLTISCSQAAASLDFQMQDEVFLSDLKGKAVKIRDEKGTFSKSVKIQKMEGIYIAGIGNISPGKSWWHIEAEGYKPMDISVDIPPVKKIIKKVTLTPTFGGVYAWGVVALEPEKPMRVPMKVRIGEFIW